MAKYTVKVGYAKIFDSPDNANVVRNTTEEAELPIYLKIGTTVIGDIVSSKVNKKFEVEGESYAMATIIKITYCDSDIEGNSGALTNQHPHTGYSILKYTSTTNGYVDHWFEEETNDNANVPSSSGTGYSDPVKNDPVTLEALNAKLSDEDQYYWSKDLYSDGIFSKDAASTISKSLQKLGGGSKVSMRLFGMPYQFMPSVDSRVSGLSTRVGAQFLQNIISEAAIVTITPGKPIYMGNYGGSAQTKTAYLISQISSLNNIAATQVNLTKQIKYYDFEEDYISYMHYVNMMCRSAAGFLGLDSVPVDSEINEILARFDWKNYRFNGIGYDSLAGNLAKDIGNALKEAAEKVGKTVVTYCSSLCDSLAEGKNLFDSMAAAWGDAGNVVKGAYNPTYPNSPESVGTTSVSLGGSASSEESESFLSAALNYLGVNENFVQFMIEPNSFTETSSNATSESQIAGTLNDQLGNTIREVRFIGGSLGAQGIMDQAESTAQSLLDALGSMGGNLGTNIVARATGAMGQLLAGDRIIFPEIFNSSSYRKDYTLTIKLKSPYGDRYSYYINILVPLFHLIALAAPKQTSGNTYDSPFLVRVFLPGQWQINMGIITDLNIERNGGDGLSVDGYPLEVNVTIGVKDLYSDLMITPTTEPSLFLCNTGLVDFIMIQCGLDVTNKNYTQKLNNAVLNIGNKYKDIYNNVADYMGQSISKKITDFFTGILH